jgi:hypothetical protein
MEEGAGGNETKNKDKEEVIRKTKMNDSEAKWTK